MGWERIVHERADLFDQVWAEPVTHVAKRMGISGVALAKICRRMSIPLPGRGYWARKAVGKAPPKPTLRPGKPDTPLTYAQHRHVGDPKDIEAKAAIRAEVERQADAGPRLKVPETLSDPHLLVARAAVTLQRGERRLNGLLLRRRCLDVEARGEALERALRIMDTVIKALEGHGHTLEVTAPKARTDTTPPTPSRTFVHVGDSTVRIAIDEAIQKIPLPLPEPRKPRTPYEYIPRPKREYEYRPTGRLRLRIVNGQLRGAAEMWTDRKSKKVEESLNEFLCERRCRRRTTATRPNRGRETASGGDRRGTAASRHRAAQRCP